MTVEAVEEVVGDTTT